jgi:alkylation response protein AidB-like acyl-CoA dehydrogenase
MIAKSKGGAFLIEDLSPDQIFTAEDLSEEHLAIARTVDDFWAKEVEPKLEAIRRQQPGVARQVLRKAAELGLTAITLPEQYGGMELDLASAIVAAEHLARDGSYSICHEVHAGIGTLPILYFGTEAQKRKYLPRLARAELVAAYALTEPQAGSDALAARTRADLSPDGTRYLLNGQKMWITNGGIADLFTVFAKVGGEKLTAFLVERASPGVGIGAEEQKMGIKGSSTTAVYFDNVPVPVENVLGEVGRGHIIAFSILNSGRMKIGTLAMGAAKSVLAISLKYAKERKAFGSAIAEFGAIQHKLAEMAIRIFAIESMIWRVTGLLEGQAAEEYAVECSILKVYGSEVLDYVVDEGVQIHGGYGYHQDYAVERAYRDARINRIYEGTNEINRLVITGMLLKRAVRGGLALFTTPPSSTAGVDEESRLVRNAKEIALIAIGLAWRRYGDATEKQQEVVMNIADIVMEVFAMESAGLRARRLGANAGEMCAVFLRDAMARVEVSARSVLGACAEGDSLHTNIEVLRRLASYDPVNAVALRRRIASRLLERERYLAG